jgi:hypothetical protein
MGAIMTEQVEVDPIEAKEEELIKQIFPWLKEKGLAHVIEQVQVTIKILKRAVTYELDENDWAIILGEEWNWTAGEQALLDAIKAKGNEPVVVPDSKEVPDHRFCDRMGVNFHRSRKPYFLSLTYIEIEGEKGIHRAASIGKLLTPKERRARKNP